MQDRDRDYYHHHHGGIELRDLEFRHAKIRVVAALRLMFVRCLFDRLARHRAFPFWGDQGESSEIGFAACSSLPRRKFCEKILTAYTLQ